MEKMETYHYSPGNKKEKTKNRGMSRRQFLKMLGISAGAAAMLGSDFKRLSAQAKYFWETEKSRYEKHGWSYTLEEMEKVYEEEYNAPEKLLKNTLQQEGEKLIGLVRGEKIEVPQKFIDKTLQHLKEMLEQKAAKFIFRLDAFHGHFFVSEKRYQENYYDLSIVEQTRKLINDGELGILYHNSEHGKFLDKKSDELTAEEKELKEKRNVIGWYDNRSIEILSLPEGGKKIAADIPGCSLGPGLLFSAHKDGIFTISHNGKEIRLDISFEDETFY